MNYREEARVSLTRAISELESGDDSRLKYAALELRMAMESLTYDRALAFKDEFPPQEFETWQPRRVLAVLLEIDEDVDQDSSIAVGIEEELGKPAATMHSLGCEKVLNSKTLKKHYDALGSYLHIPSIKQVKSGVIPDLQKLRKRCETISEFIKEVFSSSYFNVTLGNFTTINCMECNSKIRKRIPHSKNVFEAECYECASSYTIQKSEKGELCWKPHLRDITCGNSNCSHKIQVWRNETRVGAYWNCPDCSGLNRIVYGIQHTGSSELSEEEVE